MLLAHVSVVLIVIIRDAEASAPPPGPDPRSALRAGASRNRALTALWPPRTALPTLNSRSLPCPEASRSCALPIRFPPRSRTCRTRSRPPGTATGALPNQLGRSPKMSPKKSIFLSFFLIFFFNFFGFVRGP
jgi:hypothetical protein